MALWRFAVQAGFSEEPTTTGLNVGAVCAVRAVSRPEANKKELDKFLSTGGFSRQAKIETLGLCPFYSVQSVLSSQFLRTLSPDHTASLFSLQPHAAMMHGGGKNETFFVNATGHYIVGVSMIMDHTVSRQRRCSDPSHSQRTSHFCRRRASWLRGL